MGDGWDHRPRGDDRVRAEDHEGKDARPEDLLAQEHRGADLGDEDFERFVRRRGRQLTQFAYLLVADRAQAEDLVQTALVKAWLRGDRVTPAGREAYVRRTMVTTVVSWWRLGRWRERAAGVLPEPAAAPDLTTTVDQRDLLLAALRRLPPRQRSAVVLRHYAGLTEAETAAVLRCSVGTVKSQTSRGLAALRGALATAETR